MKFAIIIKSNKRFSAGSVTGRKAGQLIKTRQGEVFRYEGCSERIGRYGRSDGRDYGVSLLAGVDALLSTARQ